MELARELSGGVYAIWMLALGRQKPDANFSMSSSLDARGFRYFRLLLAFVCFSKLLSERMISAKCRKNISC